MALNLNLIRTSYNFSILKFLFAKLSHFLNLCMDLKLCLFPSHYHIHVSNVGHFPLIRYRVNLNGIKLLRYYMNLCVGTVSISSSSSLPSCNKHFLAIRGGKAEIGNQLTRATQ